MLYNGELKKSQKRLDEIVKIAKKYDLGKLLVSSRKRKVNSQGEFDENIAASNLRKAFEELGPAYVKLGQMLCTRPDMVGNEIADELKKLRDNTPVTPFSEIREVIEGELGKPLDEIYSEFKEQPIGSASIGRSTKQN